MSWTTADLVDKIFIFCEAMAYGSSDKHFYPYQAQLAKRMIRSFLENDGEEITGLQARQSGKSEVVAITVEGCSILLPILANMPMFFEDPRLMRFKDGMLIGLFAPALHQSQIIFSRIKQYMSTDSAIEIMQDPEINVSFGVNNGINVVLYFNNLNISSTITCMSASDGSNIEGKSYMVIIVDEAQDVSPSKYAKSISPMAAFYNGTKILIGTPTTQKGFFYESIERNKKDYAKGERKRNHFEYNWEYVAKYNPNYAKYIEGEKRRLGENSDEFQMSYNLKWILERGMFVTDKEFDKIANNSLGLCAFDQIHEHVVGIDFGKSGDSTVVTIGEVDWENPIIIEKSKSDDASVEDYIVYECFVKNWLEIQGDNWDSQYKDIMSFMGNYRIKRVVADATGVGAGIVDRIEANMSAEVISYVFSLQAKSDLYKHYDAQIKSGRFTYPADEETQETIVYKHFIQQHLDLVKSYSGQNMVVSHPKEKGAHDDYTDSSALMVMGARGEGVARPTTEKDNIFLKEIFDKAFYQQRNRMTGRRR